MTNLKKLNQDIFIVSLITFVLLFFAELLVPKFVIAYIDLNKIFLLTIITGTLFIFNNEEKIENENQPLKMPFMLFFSSITFIFILAFSGNFNFFSILLATAGGLVTFIFGKTLNK